MKQLLLVLLIIISSKSAGAQNNKIISGSWINIDIANYYEGNKEDSCSLNNFDNDRFIPLYLSFNNLDQVKIYL